MTVEYTKLFPDPGTPRGDVAKMLLGIVGPDRVEEIRTITHPRRGFMIPVDVAVEYTRLLAQAQQPAPAEEAPKPKRTRKPKEAKND